MIKIKELQGKGYSLGREFAKIFKDSIKIQEQKEKEVLENKEFEAVIKNIKEKYPDYLEEMYGRADGLGIDREDYLYQICCCGFNKKEACTDIVVKVDSNRILAGHNEDLSETIEEVAFIKYKEDEQFYCDFSTYNYPQGTTFGWNSNGLILSVNTIHTFEYHKQGIPAWFMLRDIIFCKDIEEIKSKIEKIHCATGFSLNVVDRKQNKAYSIEKVYEELSIIQIETQYAHTNHIIHEDSKYKSKELGSTAMRLAQAREKMKEFSSEEWNVNTIKNILQFYQDDNQYIYRPIGKDTFPTIATFIIDSQKETINIYSYYDDTLIESDFNGKIKILEIPCFN